VKVKRDCYLLTDSVGDDEHDVWDTRSTVLHEDGLSHLDRSSGVSVALGLDEVRDGRRHFLCVTRELELDNGQVTKDDDADVNRGLVDVEGRRDLETEVERLGPVRRVDRSRAIKHQDQVHGSLAKKLVVVVVVRRT